MIAVVFELPWFTAFVIKVIAADKSDAGAEGIADTLDGAMGVVGMLLESMLVVQTDFVRAVCYTGYEAY